MKRIIVALLALGLASCGNVSMPDYDEVEDLKVVSVEPADGAELLPNARIKLIFSTPVDDAGIDETTLLIYQVEDESKILSITKDAQDGDIGGIRGEYYFSDDRTEVEFAPKDGFAAGQYAVIATTRIVSTGLYPLNQRGVSNQGPFVSFFTVPASSAYTSFAEAASSDGAVPTTPVAATKQRPDFALINEVLYDAVGSDTDGNVFIELYAEAGKDISGYKILMIGGDSGQVYETLEIKDATTVPDDGIFVIADARTGASTQSNVLNFDMLANFDPQNGPDCIALQGDGQILDAVGYGSPLVQPTSSSLQCFESAGAIKVSSGHSLSRAMGYDSDDNSSDFSDNPAPTPGEL